MYGPHTGACVLRGIGGPSLPVCCLLFVFWYSRTQYNTCIVARFRPHSADREMKGVTRKCGYETTFTEGFMEFKTPLRESHHDASPFLMKTVSSFQFIENPCETLEKFVGGISRCRTSHYFIIMITLRPSTCPRWKSQFSFHSRPSPIKIHNHIDERRWNM